MEEKTERRNVTMYPAQWEGVDAEAIRRGYVTARGANTSLMLRQIVKAFLESGIKSQESKGESHGAGGSDG